MSTPIFMKVLESWTIDFGKMDLYNTLRHS